MNTQIRFSSLVLFGCCLAVFISSASVLAATTKKTPIVATSISGLIRYWKFNRDVKDNVTGISLWNQHNAAKYVGDRHGKSLSALWFNMGWIQMPVSVYFSGSYSTTLWIYVLGYSGNTQTVYTLSSNQQQQDSFGLYIVGTGALQAQFGMFSNELNQVPMDAVGSMKLTKWVRFSV